MDVDTKNLKQKWDGNLVKKGWKDEKESVKDKKSKQGIRFIY